MQAAKSMDTPGQKLWLSLYRAEEYQKRSANLPEGTDKLQTDVNRATRNWLAGMSSHMRKKFPEQLRSQREKVGITQQQLADIAELSVTAVAMIERGERSPNLDTAARLCWALDAAAGVTIADLTP